jgi:hypothetical protein
MSNMSYCRFENTLDDLRDCRRALLEEGIIDLEKNASHREEPCVMELIELCQKITREFDNDEYGDDYDNDEEEE